eukprot:6424757-Pyramimonas_sp.AAC.1
MGERLAGVTPRPTARAHSRAFARGSTRVSSGPQRDQAKSQGKGAQRRSSWWTSGAQLGRASPEPPERGRDRRRPKEGRPGTSESSRQGSPTTPHPSSRGRPRP